MKTNIQISAALRGLVSLSIIVFFASIGRCDEERPSADDLKRAIKSFYSKHYTRPLSYLGNPDMNAGRLQHVQRFEVKNSYTRRIDDEQFHFCDVAVEIQIPNTGGPPYGGVVTELLPLKFVKRGNWWYSSRNLETEIQQLPNGSLSKNAIVCANNPVPKTSPAATPDYGRSYEDLPGFAKSTGSTKEMIDKLKSQNSDAPRKDEPRKNNDDWEDRPGNARSMGATQEMIDAANGDGKSNAKHPTKQKLVRFANRARTCSVLVPTDVFANNPSQPNDEDMTFNAEGKTELSVTVRPVDPDTLLNDVFNNVLSARASSESTTGNNVVDYKVVKQDWFVVSGSANGRGYYVKCIRKGGALFFMDLEYDEHACPISKESFTRMSQGFRVDAAKEE